MDRYEKVNRIKKLDEAKQTKRKEAAKAQKELEDLIREYSETRIPEVPILLFLLDQSFDFKFERKQSCKYIYYCPDLDDVITLTNQTDKEFLPNTIDMREDFKSLDVPSHINWSGGGISYPKLEEATNIAVQYLRERTNELFANREVNSWDEVREYFQSKKEDHNSVTK